MASGTLATVDYISELISASRFDLRDLLQEVVLSAAYRLDLKASAVSLVHPETGEVVVRAVYGLSEDFITRSSAFDIRSRLRRLEANGGKLVVADIQSEVDREFAESAALEGIHSLLAVGLYRDDELIGALSVYSGSFHRFTSAEIKALQIIANPVSVAVSLVRLHAIEVEKERLENELDLAAEIQKRVLPEKAPQVPGFRIACRYTPWERIGGDFYDFLELPQGNLGIVVGDVSGKGVWAALLSLVVRTAVRAHAEYQYAVGDIVAHVNQRLFLDTEAGQFATMSYAVLNLRNRMLTYVTTLCPPPIVVRNGAIVDLDTGGLALGILPDQKYGQEVFTLEPGDLVVMYSDGYSEVFNPREEMFGDERVRACILANRHLAPDDQIQILDDEVEAFLNGSKFGDDRTIVMIAVDAAA